MLYQLIPLEKYEDDSEELFLDDFSSGSEAVYQLKNPERLSVIYFCSDEQRGEEPRCDYLVCVPKMNMVKYIELKGTDSGGCGHSCCRTSWEHGFHQLEATYGAYYGLLESKDEKYFVLCTALPRKRINTRYKSYTRYRRLKEIEGGNVLVLCRDEWDVVNNP